MTDLRDLETRLSEALERGAQDAPPATGLAAAARGRARQRRRTRLAAGGAVLAVLLGVPTAVLAARTGGGGGVESAAPADHGTVAKDPAGAGHVLPDGYRVESWHDVSVAVPGSWRPGSLSSWCADGGGLQPARVERPDTPTPYILCTPRSTYGVRFQQIDRTDEFAWPVVEQTGEGWPPGAYVGGRAVDGVLVTVTAPRADLAQEVLASVQGNTGIDPNGCALTADGAPVVPGDTMTVCRYDGTGLLEQSELLTGADVGRAEAALTAAPTSVSGAAACPSDAGAQTIRLASIAQDATITLGADCASLTVHDQSRALTSDVLYWALSPGWPGGVTAGIPLPAKLRTE